MPPDNFPLLVLIYERLSFIHNVTHLSVSPFKSALLAGYFPNGGGPTAPDWPENDYDTNRTVTLDATGNVTVGNAKFQGIDSAALAATGPRFQGLFSHIHLSLYEVWRTVDLYR
jgi:hypothetical protein